ncbi:glycoside hydrolase [Apiospora phragmitis]|uniref:Glycoside hydrolase n=1 Tax=Apiospora phragmitis TaxID=2905665 RepID=A0ABR1WSH8_9PEZI
MPGINQLPEGAEGVVAFSLIYAAASWTCSALFILVARVYREGFSYLSILSFFTLFSTTASIIQQAHDATWYRDVMIAQFEHKQVNPDSPENAIANGSIGLDLVLYYLQYYSYSVEAMLVMFWAGELAQTVYGLSAKLRLRPLLQRINTVGKWISILFPMVTIVLLRLPALQAHFIIFILIADLPLMISLAIGSGTVIAILARYINSRKRFTNWTPQQGTGNTSQSGATIQSTAQSSSSHGKGPMKQGLYDRWLMVRFTCAFVVLAVFEVTNTLFQVQSLLNTKKDAASVEPDLSVERAKTTFFLFLPGNTRGSSSSWFSARPPGVGRPCTTSSCRRGCRGDNGGSRGGCIPWSSRSRRRPAPVVIHEDPESRLFDRPDDIRSDMGLTGRGELTQSHDLNKPLPLVAMSRYNRYQGERDSPSPRWQQYRGDRVQVGRGRTKAGSRCTTCDLSTR